MPNKLKELRYVI